MTTEVLTKKQFARLVQRDPAFVSRAIASGQITAAALVGEGRHARVRVQVALEELGRSLDVAQQLAQAQPILPEVKAAEEEKGGLQDLREEQLELRNRKARLEVERAEREAAAAAGELLRASDVAAALRRQVGPLVATFDEVPAAVAARVASAFSLEYPAVLIAVREALREARQSWATRARAFGEMEEV